MDNNIQTTLNKAAVKPKKKVKTILIIIIAVAVLALIATGIYLFSTRSVFFSKKNMIDSVKGSYTQTISEGDYHLSYQTLTIGEDKVEFHYASYSAWADDTWHDSEYTIKSWNCLLGKIDLGHKHYLIVNKDGTISEYSGNSKRAKVYK